MKTLLAAVNAKYVHSNLAIRYIEKSIPDCETAEYTINDRKDTAVRDIYLKQPDVVVFSCYIWNIEFILKISKTLKQILPKTVIVLGGPEVSYDPVELLEEHEYIDYIIAGEGDFVTAELIENIKNKKNKDIRGVYDRGKNGSEFAVAENLNQIPRPYTEKQIKALEGHIIYYETSRGCPFSCSYCLSGEDKGVRYFDTERAFEDIMLFCKNNVPLIKLVDRTFNANTKRAIEIIRFIKSNSRVTRFHFEVTAELVTDEFIEEIAEKPQLFQLEIGIQSTNEKTLEAICRKNDFDKITEVVNKLKKAGISLHLDAICGLPYEDFERFKKTFNDIYGLKGDMFQLGFLKLLKGSKIRREAQLHEYVWDSEAPYEILFGNAISYDEILRLKTAEESLERYYNSGAFKFSMKYLEGKTETPFELYDKLGQGLRENISRRELYMRVYEMFGRNEVLKEALSFDFRCNQKGELFPKNQEAEWVKLCHDLLHSDSFIEKYLPEYKGDFARDIIKNIKMCRVKFAVWNNFESCDCLVIFNKGRYEICEIKEVCNYV